MRGGSPAMPAIRPLVPLLVCAALAAESQPVRLEPAADFGDQQATGGGIRITGRVFVSFPAWSDTYPPVAVAEVMPDGQLQPFPDGAWNAWQPGSAPDARWVCAQSAVADSCGSLWALAPASPRMEGVVAGGAKLVQIDLAENRVVRVIRFDATIAPAKSYLNDVRVSPDQRWAFITDSGLGALVVVDLASNAARRLLAGHPSVMAERDRPLAIEGQPL